MKAHILVIEDDAAIRAGIVDTLELESFQVSQAGDFFSGRRAALNLDVHLILLDLVMPGGDGLDILAALQSARPSMPVIILTARGSETDRVKGLRGGADDYLVKPFGSAELLARITAVLRRTGTRVAAQTPETIQIKGISIDFAKHEAMLIDGTTVTLTPQECDLLRFLSERRDRVVQRSELQNLLWKGHVDFSSRAIDMLVGRLREKLGDDSRESKIIVTVRGSGYRLGDS